MCRVHIFSGLFGSFGSAVDERMTGGRSCLALSVGFIYMNLAARLARQWIKERGIIDMRVRVNKPNELAHLVHG